MHEEVKWMRGAKDIMAMLDVANREVEGDVARMREGLDEMRTSLEEMRGGQETHAGGGRRAYARAGI